MNRGTYPEDLDDLAYQILRPHLGSGLLFFAYPQLPPNPTVYRRGLNGLRERKPAVHGLIA